MFALASFLFWIVLAFTSGLYVSHKMFEMENGSAVLFDVKSRKRAA